METASLEVWKLCLKKRLATAESPKVRAISGSQGSSSTWTLSWSISQHLVPLQNRQKGPSGSVGCFHPTMRLCLLYRSDTRILNTRIEPPKGDTHIFSYLGGFVLVSLTTEFWARHPVLHPLKAGRCNCLLYQPLTHRETFSRSIRLISIIWITFYPHDNKADVHYPHV